MPLHPLLAERLAVLTSNDPGGVEYDTPYGAGEATEFDIRNVAAPGPHGDIPVRVYRHLEPPAQPRPALVWCHGGGFTAGSLDMPEGDQTSRAIAARTGGTVVSVDYRLVTDTANKYPVPHDDVNAAYTWAVENAGDLNTERDRIALGGASAGANLISGVALRLRDEGGPVPPLVLPIYPIVHQRLPPFSEELASKLDEVRWTGRLIELPNVADMNAFFLGGREPDAYVAAGEAADLSGYPRTLIINAEYDTLRASGEEFTRRLREDGVEVREEFVPGVLHGHLNLIGFPPALDSFTVMAEEIRRL